MSFAQKILNWYHENQRDLPWRRTRDPYKVWLSEIILQQTRVVQGMPYYLRFVDAFPTVQDLAKAPEEQVLKLWQGLGYYSRARNLHATAKIVANNFDGQFPNTYKELKTLKGVGDYTASAIASFCFDAPEPVVDGNVYRVLSRYFGVDIPINSTKGIRYFKELAREVMDSGNIRDYNQGIMEFGAVQCAPKKTYCLLCPLQESCVAVKDGKVSELPLKLNKTKVKNRYFNYVIPIDPENNTILEQRTAKGIWQNLYQFPLVESDKNLKAEELKLLIQGNGQLPEYESLSLYNNETIVHKLSHQHLHTKFWILKTSYILEEGTPWKKIGDFPVPVLIADFIKTFKI
ncbi:A/G-specific adenine glycosylase [Flagellimonas marinaquae]|uniref:A/G-specific adenine glycosylase n=1 Tax=Flagellimonas marinaquae TaxID=254955 RepID=UPI0020750EFC|nr:A/G-specific adenine glycosylase [Allomuricauda aquimarina]USD26494.1 A/G-specific adenine glycosylase [Allomuricauda aquimarina]